MKKTILFICSCISLSMAAQDRSMKFEEGKWADVVAKAGKENKFIFVDCYTTWCGPCKWLAKNVFTKNEVADFYNDKFICYELDMEKGEGVELAKQWAIKAYPSLLFFNSKGELVHRSCGVDYRDDFYKDFIVLGTNAMDPAKQFVAKQKIVQTGKADPQTWAEYVVMLTSACQPFDEELRKYMATQTDEELLRRYNWNVIYNVVNDYNSREIKYLLAHRKDFEQLYTTDSVMKKLEAVYSDALLSAAPDAYENLKNEVRNSGINDAEKIILRADMHRYKSAKDWANYARVAITYTDMYSTNSPEELNSMAWTFYQKIDDKGLLGHAEGWASRAVELQPNYANTDTYAAVLYKLGKLEEAKKQAKAAIELAKKEKTDYKETQQLLDKMNGVK